MAKLFFFFLTRNPDSYRERIVPYLKTFTTKKNGKEQVRWCTLFCHRSLIDTVSVYLENEYVETGKGDIMLYGDEVSYKAA